MKEYLKYTFEEKELMDMYIGFNLNFLEEVLLHSEEETVHKNVEIVLELMLGLFEVDQTDYPLVADVWRRAYDIYFDSTIPLLEDMKERKNINSYGLTELSVEEAFKFFNGTKEFPRVVYFS